MPVAAIHQGSTPRSFGHATMNMSHSSVRSSRTPPSSVMAAVAAGLVIGAGSRLSAHCTALGKALLASLPEREFKAIVHELVLHREGPKAITREGELSHELAQIRDVGFAVEDEELAAGVLLVAAPIRVADEVFGALVVSAPVALIDRKALVEQCGSHLLAASERIASVLEPNQSKEET
jgi:DNA-binding IclR family transcriptional regulator